jgi:anti-sigma B factor antagonist
MVDGVPEAKSPQPIPGQLVIESKREGDAVVLVLSGELDLASAPQLERALGEAEATNPSRLVIDMGGLAFMDSTGLQALLRARGRAASDGQQLWLRRAPHQVQRVFELTRTADAFNFED